SNDDARYSNSVATDINDNLFAVGYSKRNGFVPESGSAGNKIFVVTDASAVTPTATYLSGGIFFGGSSGEAKAVN
ncbi:GlyGly-CTERM sorting domain-containing protein, partial [Vibrio sp. 10N.222.54.F6]